MAVAKPTLSIILPCLNEASSIDVVIPHLQECLQKWADFNENDFEIIIVDDNSSDNSVELIKKYPAVRAILNETRLGYGGALKKGFREANGQYLAFFDLDRTYDAADLQNLFYQLVKEDLSVVFGDRMSLPNQMPRLRRLGNFFYVQVVNWLYGTKLKDACTGMRIFKKEISEFVEKIPENGLNFSIAFTSTVLNIKAPMLQIPIKYHERIGNSKLSIVFDGVSFFNTICRYYRIRNDF